MRARPQTGRRAGVALIGLGLCVVVAAVVLAPAALVLGAAAGVRIIRLGVVATLWTASAAGAWAALCVREPDAAPRSLVVGWALATAGVASATYLGGGSALDVSLVVPLVATAAGMGLGIGAVARRRSSAPAFAAAAGLALVGAAHGFYVVDVAVDDARSFLDVVVLVALVVAGGMSGVGAALARGWQLWRQRAVRAERLREQVCRDLERVIEERAALLHETRNVLSVVDAASYALQQARDMSPSDRRRLERAVRDELRLLGELLDRTEAAGWDDSATDVGELVERQVSLAASRGLHVQVDVEEAPLVAVPRQVLEEVLVNLLLNAERHGRGADVHITARHDRERGEVVLCVSDRGPGLRRDPRRASRGLGLKICRRLLAQVGGQLNLAPRPGGGVEATVKVPVGGAGWGETPDVVIDLPDPVAAGPTSR